MQKVINSHCHIYPDKIAAKAVKGIRDFYDLHMSLNGTVNDLIEDGNKVGAVHYLIHSVATTPKQVQSINEFISFEVKSHPGLFTGFGTLHPDSEDIEGDLDYIIELGLKGVKVHPDFQQFALNEEKAFKMGEAINERGLPIMIHCGDFRSLSLVLILQDGACGKRQLKNWQELLIYLWIAVQAYMHCLLKLQRI